MTFVCLRCISGWLPSDKKNRLFGKFFEIFSELSVEDGVVFRVNRTVNLEKLPPQVLQLAHEGHPGIVKMRQRLQDCAWWPGINSDVDSHVKLCQPCQLSKKSVRPSNRTLQQISFPPKHWHTVSLDIKVELHG